MKTEANAIVETIDMHNYNPSNKERREGFECNNGVYVMACKVYEPTMDALEDIKFKTEIQPQSIDFNDSSSAFCSTEEAESLGLDLITR